MIRFFVDPLIAQVVEKNKSKSLLIFLGAEVLIALVTGGLLWSFSKWAFVILLVLRSAFLGFSTISEEVLWIRTFPKDKVGLLFGLNQSGFFLGDFIGGMGNGYLYKNFGLDTCIIIVLVVMLLNAALFLKFFKAEENGRGPPSAGSSMLKDLRSIWTEDQYQLLGKADLPGFFYFGRQKENRFQVFRRSTSSVRRQLVQSVSLKQDWYWCQEQKKLVSEKPLKRRIIPRRREHVLSGFNYSKGALKKTLENLSEKSQVIERTLPTGAQVIWLIPENPTSWILSLHGGPESSEGCEIRYGGLYRDLLRNKKAIAILNYRGSSNLDAFISQQAWGRWQKSIFEDFKAVSKDAVSKTLAGQPGSIFGVSFGGALALLLQKKFKIQTAVLSLHFWISKSKEIELPYGFMTGLKRDSALKTSGI